MSSSLSSSIDSWYTHEGPDNDVVISGKIRVARNLANFPFPIKLSSDELKRVEALVYDAFNSTEESSSFQAISVANLDSLGGRILQERGVLDAMYSKESSVLVRNDGKFSCTVNNGDHLRFSAFSSGFNLEDCFNSVTQMDKFLQNKLQFAASYDFGYLTSSIYDAGSGMKMSLDVYLPCVSAMGRLGPIISDLEKDGYELSAKYGAGEKGSSLGCYYTVSSKNQLSGSELDQYTTICSIAKRLMETERNLREDCNTILISNIKNKVYRALALAKASLFISQKEAVDIISCIKWGKSMKLVSGIDDTILNALLYRVLYGHLQYVLGNGNFTFEKDIADNRVKKNERLRSLILQEAFESVVLI